MYSSFTYMWILAILILVVKYLKVEFKVQKWLHKVTRRFIIYIVIVVLVMLMIIEKASMLEAE